MNCEPPLILFVDKGTQFKLNRLRNEGLLS